MLAPDLDRALAALGEQLGAAGSEASIVIVGGAALALTDVVGRATEDIDVIARLGRAGELEPPEPFPVELAQAAAKVGRDLRLSPAWLNGIVGAQWRTGLPPGFAERIRWRSYGALRLGIAGRQDLIALKLYAAADDVGPDSRHFQDLLALAPSLEDLALAEAWVRGQDASSAFHETLGKVIDHARRRAR